MATQEVKAWTYTSGYPKGLHQTTIYPPTTTTGDNILVQIHAAALNPVDIQMMNEPSHNYPWSATYNKEKIAGCDFSGTVLASGDTEFQKGDEIYGVSFMPFGGTIAQVVQFNMAATCAVKKPKSWSWEQAAAVPLVWLTAKESVESVAPFVEASEGKKVAVLGGSSATGIYTILLAKKLGWKVVTTSSGRNKEFVTKTLGADEHVDYTTGPVRAKIQAFGPVAVIDCVGGTECIGFPSSKRYSSIVGDKSGRASMGGPDTYYNVLAPLNAGKQWLRWAKGYVGWGESYDVISLGLNANWLEEASSTLTPDSCYIDSVFSFRETKEAFERLNTGRARGKVVVSIVSE